jgi:hypothetical protein
MRDVKIIKKMIESRISEILAEVGDYRMIERACGHLYGEDREICERIVKTIMESKSVEDLLKRGIIV